MSTIFLCTWVAWHPDMPSVYASRFDITFERVRWMLILLIAPEVGVMAAMEDYLIARKIVESCRSTLQVLFNVKLLT